MAPAIARRRLPRRIASDTSASIGGRSRVRSNTDRRSSDMPHLQELSERVAALSEMGLHRAVAYPHEVRDARYREVGDVEEDQRLALAGGEASQCTLQVDRVGRRPRHALAPGEG